MSKDPKVGTGKKPKGSGRRLYTDENPKDTVSVEFSSAAAIRRTLAKKSFKSKSHKRQSQIINLIHQRARAAYNNAKDPKVKKRLKGALDYAEERKEASKRKTQRMKKEEIDMDLLTAMIVEELEATLDEKKRKRKKKRRRKRKLTKKPSSETSLRDWFKRKGAPGKKGGWVDCNAPRYKDGKKVGYKACGRQKGEKRSKYPACRPTAAACKSRGKGKKWGKKAKKGMKETMNFSRTEIFDAVSEELRDLVEVYYYIPEAFYDDGSPALVEFYEDVIEEAEYRGRKVKLNKPMRGDVKKFKVYVKDPKTGNVKKVNFGDPNMRIRKSNPKARKSFRARHNCKNPGPKTKARYWSCKKW